MLMWVKNLAKNDQCTLSTWQAKMIRTWQCTRVGQCQVHLCSRINVTA